MPRWCRFLSVYNFYCNYHFLTSSHHSALTMFMIGGSWCGPHYNAIRRQPRDRTATSVNLTVRKSPQIKSYYDTHSLNWHWVLRGARFNRLWIRHCWWKDRLHWMTSIRTNVRSRAMHVKRDGISFWMQFLIPAYYIHTYTIYECFIWEWSIFTYDKLIVRQWVSAVTV